MSDSNKLATSTKEISEINNDKRPHINLVFIGHVDAGKSTTSGQILYITGKVDKRTIERYEREAKEKKRDSWYLAYIMDISEEERLRGKTFECGKASFETDKKRITLLDAPGHSAYVPSMIVGTSQADIGALVISARIGEFEAGLERGQTPEHIMLSKTLGLQYLFILVNKMDDPSVLWSKTRYDNIVEKITPLLETYNYTPDQYCFLPTSAFTADNIKNTVSKDICPWHDGRTFFQLLDNLDNIIRYDTSPLRITISSRYKDRTLLYLVGKVESGIQKRTTPIISVPVMKVCDISSITIEDLNDEVQEAKCGENVIIAIKNLEEDDVPVGSILSPQDIPGYRAEIFEAQIMVTDVNDSIPVITVGYECVLHIHNIVIECRISALVSELNKRGKVKSKKPKFFVQGSIGIVRIAVDTPIAIEKFQDFPRIGRFTLRDRGKSIAIGKVLRIKPV